MNKDIEIITINLSKTNFTKILSSIETNGLVIKNDISHGKTIYRLLNLIFHFKLEIPFAKSRYVVDQKYFSKSLFNFQNY